MNELPDSPQLSALNTKILNSIIDGHDDLTSPHPEYLTKNQLLAKAVEQGTTTIEAGHWIMFDIFAPSAVVILDRLRFNEEDKKLDWNDLISSSSPEHFYDSFINSDTNWFNQERVAGRGAITLAKAMEISKETFCEGVREAARIFSRLG